MLQSGRWGRSSLWLLRVVCGLRVEFRGLHHVPKGGLIVASKHQSFWEVFAFLTIFPDFTYVLKSELAKIPLFGLYARAGEQIAIDRARGRAALAQVSEQAKGVLAEGRTIADLSRRHAPFARSPTSIQVRRRPYLRRNGRQVFAGCGQFRPVLAASILHSPPRYGAGGVPRTDRTRARPGVVLERTRKPHRNRNRAT